MDLHISRLEIENFRNFVALKVDPFPSNAVIVGENRIGKSNLLSATFRGLCLSMIRQDDADVA